MSYQKVIIQGNLGQDVDLKYDNNGKAVARISVATTERWTDKNTQQKQEKTSWHRLVAFGRTAEVIGEYLRKGSNILVDGKLQYSKYTDSAGIEKWSTDIVIDQMQMLDSRGDNQGAQQQPNYPQPEPSIPTQKVPQQQSQGATVQNNGIPNPDFDDDVPF